MCSSDLPILGFIAKQILSLYTSLAAHVAYSGIHRKADLVAIYVTCGTCCLSWDSLQSRSCRYMQYLRHMRPISSTFVSPISSTFVGILRQLLRSEGPQILQGAAVEQTIVAAFLMVFMALGELPGLASRRGSALQPVSPKTFFVPKRASRPKIFFLTE